ncbi:MAG: 4-hydroxythreonine-4-phosphate dehydrogenase PdxA [Gammaproteobacteria bacterium]
MVSTNTRKRTKIVVTAGEPAGIGADICLSLPALGLYASKNTELYVIADPDLLDERARLLGSDVELNIHKNLHDLSSNYDCDKLNIIPLSLRSSCQAGKLNPENSAYVLQMLDLACDLCLQDKVDAMVTAPVQKNIINEAGYAFTGHTEYLAERSSSRYSIWPVMMLTTKTLRVALATTHLPLKKVSQAITKDSLTQTLKILNNFLKHKAAIPQPRILVCGLNPHAGENGNLGDEEITTIIPVIEKLKQQGLDLLGPLPADTLFTPKYLEHADAVLAMYHDQGLPVLKYSGFGKAVNITLGLPFVRTSVDHGTALDLAGTGKASASSLHEAIKMAIEYSISE